MSRPPLPTAAAAGAAIAFLVAAIVFGVPYLRAERTAHTGTPVPPPFADITPIVLEPGERACQEGVAVAADTGVVRVLAADQPRGVPLRVSVRAADWRATGTSGRDYGGYDAIDVPIAGPPQAVFAEVCVENAGERRVRLQGTTEPRVFTRTRTTVDGELVEPRMSLVLLESQPTSVADPDVLEHATAFNPPVAGPVTIALVLLLAALGVPAAVVFAIHRGLRDDELGR